LAFGASLTGVSIDYAVHFYCHVALAPASSGLRATLRGLLPSLALGAGTTVLGFLVLLVASFPGLRELALFAAAGLSAALLGSWLFLPGLVAAMQPTAACAALARALVGESTDQALDTAPGIGGRARGWRRRGPWLLVLLAALTVAAVGLPMARFDDGMAGLNRIDPVLQAEDQRVLAQVARFEQRRMVVAVGVVLSALTTLSGFGLLALSPQPALASIGIAAGVGIATCLLLALSTAALLARNGPRR
jgi:predicted exporter